MCVLCGGSRGSIDRAGLGNTRTVIGCCGEKSLGKCIFQQMKWKVLSFLFLYTIMYHHFKITFLISFIIHPPLINPSYVGFMGGELSLLSCKIELSGLSRFQLGLFLRIMRSGD